MSRVAIVISPSAPAKCLICAKDANGIEPFIDFNFDFDYYGAVNICKHCFMECLHLFAEDEIPVAQFYELEAQLGVANAELDQLRSFRDSILTVVPATVETESDGVEESTDSKQPDDNESTESVDSEFESDSDDDGQDSSGGPEDIPLFAS